MAFTRFHDDPARLAKYAEETSYAGRYYLNTPGQGINLPFLEDPNIRLQKWGANLTNNTVNLESDLRGLTRPLCHDVIEVNQYDVHAVTTIPYMYRNSAPFVEESRASHPAFMYRDLEQARWEHPWINPLANIERKFEHSIQTRILEKDSFVPKIPRI
jgi:hypothetical protein